MLYTSGSTGTPKGVLVPHRAVVNLATAAAQLYGLRPGGRVLHAADLTSDFSVEELFPAWLSGAEVVLAPAGALFSGESFTELLERQRVNVVLLPTAVWHAWVEELRDGQRRFPSELHVVSIGGEAVRPELFDLWQSQRSEHVRWFNTYGPTEATVEATQYEPSRSERLGRAQIPIGRPIANTRVHILDSRRQQVPIGVPGELCIGGDGVALGYADQPSLTADRFIPDPFGAPGGRLYRTGDRARIRSDGAVEFLGRVDHQVKVRGYRVELGEVEAALREHPAVRQAVVTAREDSPGHRRLVAYVVPDGATTASDLRRALAERLPDYMVPVAFVFLERLPLTPSGKVSRRELPPPGETSPDADRPFLAPRGETEVAIAGTWRELLRVDRVGADDNFFALGGHSLLATQVVSRMRSTLGVELPLRLLFEAPTVEALARHVESLRGKAAPEGPRLVRVSREAYRAPANPPAPTGSDPRTMEDR